MIRDVQTHFNPSTTFAPWLQRERDRRAQESKFERRKRKPAKREMNVKIGHGGTLDPLATGVLILGIGTGTKQLNFFTTECTKSYEAVLLFGAATDTYDSEGKIVARQPFEHITREAVEAALAKHRGKGMQRPPIYSALRVQGKRLYEYAREGKEVPVEIKERPVDVSSLELVEWMDGGTHQWHWPEREADIEEKTVAQKVLHLDDAAEATVEDAAIDTAKRKRDEGENEPIDAAEEATGKRLKAEGDETASATLPPSASASDPQGTANVDPQVEASAETKDDPAQPAAPVERPPCLAPACKIRMTVTSGFYVRSLCHDLGADVGSLGIMTNLVRTRQGQFELGTNVLPYEDLAKGEDVWGPQVREMLEKWEDKAKA